MKYHMKNLFFYI